MGCGQKCRAFAYGHGMVVEFRTAAGDWKAFRADIIPEVVDDIIKKHQVAFNKAAQCLTPEDVYDLIPRTYPKANPVALAGFKEFPGLRKFDLKKWAEEDQPVLTTEGWMKLVMLIASKNFEDFSVVFETAKTQLGKKGITYVPSGKSDAVGELLMAKFD